MDAILIVAKHPEPITHCFHQFERNVRILHTESMERAAVLLCGAPIQVMILDCAGDLEDEISLLDTVHEKCPRMEVILLVSVEKFVEIQCTRCCNLRRIMNPMERSELRGALNLALDKVHQTDWNRLTVEPDFRKKQERHFWEHLLNKVLVIDQTGMCNTAFPTSFDYKNHQTVFPILFSLRRWKGNPTAQKKNALRYGILTLCKKKLVQVFGGSKISQLPDTLLVVLYGQRHAGEKELYAICEEISALSDSCFQCEVSSYIGRPCLACELRDVVKQLYAGDRQNVTALSGVFLLSQLAETKEMLTSPTPRNWMILFNNGRKTEFYQCIEDYFLQAIAANRMDGTFLLAFQLDFVQEIGFALKQVGIPAHEIFLELEKTESKRRSLRSVPDMLVWVRQAVELAMEKIDGICAEGTIAQKACHYINQNLNHPITRQGLCECLHLSESHVARTFREEMGTNITSYVAARRIDLAKELLKNSSIPASMVAERAGFKEYSHFFKTFKKITGLSPAGYRRRTQTNGTVQIIG